MFVFHHVFPHGHPKRTISSASAAIDFPPSTLIIVRLRGLLRAGAEAKSQVRPGPGRVQNADMYTSSQ